MQSSINGTAYVLGDNIDTDQIIPAEHLVYSISDPEESAKYGQFALSGVPPSQAGMPFGETPFVSDNMQTSSYSIIIGGSNFGCGSSREHAPFALQKAGIKVVIAESYARIFYRNAVDGGFLIPIECDQRLSRIIETGEQLDLDLQHGKLMRSKGQESFSLKPLGDVLPIIEAGGLFQYARKTGMIV